MAHDHNHGSSQLSGKKLFFVTLLNAVITITEIIGGLVSGSLALLSDALHNLSDTLAIVLTYVTNRIGRKDRDVKKTFGYKRAEILAAFVNASMLTVISGYLIVESIKRFFNPELIDTGLMLIVAIIGLVANLLSVFLLKQDAKNSMNVKSSYLHMMGDTLSSVAVIFGGILIRYFNVFWLDSVLTLLIALYILHEIFEVLMESIDILMQASPIEDLNPIVDAIQGLNGVNNIHHIHIWKLDDEQIHFEAHIDFEDELLSKIQIKTEEIRVMLHDNYDIEHVTIQAETGFCCAADVIVKSSHH